MPDTVPLATRQSWDLVDEVTQILKTAFPLLILTLETVVEQILQRFKASPEEEIYRLTCMLLQDAMSVRSSTLDCLDLCSTRLQQYISRATADDDGQLPAQTVGTLNRLVLNLAGSARVSLLSAILRIDPLTQVSRRSTRKTS